MNDTKKLERHMRYVSLGFFAFMGATLASPSVEHYLLAKKVAEKIEKGETVFTKQEGEKIPYKEISYAGGKAYVARNKYDSLLGIANGWQQDEHTFMGYIYVDHGIDGVVDEVQKFKVTKINNNVTQDTERVDESDVPRYEQDYLDSLKFLDAKKK